MSMRRPKTDNSANSSRSRVIDFKEGYLLNDIEEHLPVEAQPVSATVTDTNHPLQGDISRMKNVALGENGFVAWVKKEWEMVMGWFRDKVHKQDNEDRNGMMADNQLLKMSHLDARHVEELVASDLTAFATKYLAGFSPDTITQTQLDSMVSLGKDVYNNSMSNHIKQLLSDNQGRSPRNSSPPRIPASPPRKSAPPRIPASPAISDRPPTDISDPPKVIGSRRTMASPISSIRKQNTTSYLNTETTQSPLDKKMSMREMQPRLQKAVAETLDSFGIQANGVIDTRKMARMHQLESMLRT
jgi:hypothetical protein